jgi:site-specific DNA-methyltransferase (adenine-specific)
MIKLFHGDCIHHINKLISEGTKVDFILTDLPYGTTQNVWDVVINFEDMWKCVWKILKEDGCAAFFCDGLFMAKLMLSDVNWKFNRVWDKKLSSGFLNANKMPLRTTEEIAFFYRKQPYYNPQKTKGVKNHSKNIKPFTNNNYGDFNCVDNSDTLGDMKHPTSLISISKPHASIMIHPTQKPVELLEELIRTYTREDETVLDFCMGSGSTGIACKQNRRNFIGIELKSDYYNLAKTRIESFKIKSSLI